MVDEFPTDRREKSGIEVKIDYIIDRVKDIEDKLERHYVSQDEFKPVRSIVYGMVALMLTAVVTAMVAMVLKS